jgi:hypothetical protein
MVKNALLSALVIQRQTEAATSHLRRLLFQQVHLFSLILVFMPFWSLLMEGIFFNYIVIYL